jgi:Predicted membrane protein (DUF2079)
MSEVAAAVSGQRGGSAPLPETYQLLGRVRRIGYGLLIAQFIGFLAWSAVLYFHFSVTSDYSTYNQPWFLIAHGNLDPYSTISNMPFWQNDAEFMPWVLAPLYWLGRNDLLFPWLQDASVSGAEVVVFTWLCELARRRSGERDAAWLACLGLLLFVANPWLWWATSFDVHEEALVIFFAAFLAWDVSRNKRRAWVWVLPVLLGGAPSATYVVGIGLGGMLARRRIRDKGAAIALVGIAYSLLIVAVHGDVGVPLARHYGYLATGSSSLPAGFGFADLVEGIAEHPFRVLGALWDKRADIMANLGPSGLVGLGAPAILPVTLVVVLANSLSNNYQFAEPLFQSLPVYVLLPAGTVAVLAWLLQRQHRPWLRRASFALAGLLAAQAVGWAVVWGPQTPREWLLVPGAEAATLASVAAGIPASAEVAASQGVLGRFSGRAHVYGLTYPGSSIPLDGESWFIVSPRTGIETLSPAASMTLIGELAGPLHATLLVHANDVWAFRLTSPPGTHQIIVPDGSDPLPAWAASGAAGFPVLDGPVSGWHMAATGAKGYVADGLEWLEPAGRYRASVTLSAASPVNVEVWDDTSGTLLARQSIPGTTGIQQVTLPVAAPDDTDDNVYAGWGPFRAVFTNPPPGQRIEVRVWSAGGGAVNVYSAMLIAAPVPGPRPAVTPPRTAQRP